MVKEELLTQLGGWVARSCLASTFAECLSQAGALSKSQLRDYSEMQGVFSEAEIAVQY
jgi:hypothetical protein